MSRVLFVLGLVILLSASGAGAISSAQAGASAAAPPAGMLAYVLGGRAGGSISVWNHRLREREEETFDIQVLRRIFYPTFYPSGRT
jgi:hypothetical protein